MSAADRTWAWVRPELPATRVLAVLATVGLLGSVVSILYGIVEVDGDPTTLLVLVGVAVVAATVLARVVRVVVAVGLAAVILTAGLGWYLLSLPHDPQVVAMIESNLELLGGQSILEIDRSTVWALSIAPTPVFVTWYLSVRGWYTGATLVGGTTLGYFVLTGDATAVQTLLGVVSGGALLGFGDLDRGSAPIGGAESVAVVLAVMVIAPLLVTVTPAGPATSQSLPGTASGNETVESSLVNTDTQFEVTGDIELSPKVRYTVRASESRYWRVASFDRYSGAGWIRTGDAVPYDVRGLQAPPGEFRRVVQTFEAESPIATMPASWRPVDVSSGFASRTEVTAIGGLKPTEPLGKGDTYRVTSAVPLVSPEELATAGSDDPQAIAEKYTQLPADTPARLGQRTERITADASNRYETVQTVEGWLEANREYSLDVEKPDGNVADAFLFEMERGYCVYYATTMVAMLRSQDVPARLTVGYTPGEQVGPDEYLVRGYNSHAWVEVYFPEEGWIGFDPTPAGPRVDAERERFERARAENTSDIYPDNSPATPTPTVEGGETPTPTPTPTGPADIEETTTPAIPDVDDGQSGGGSGPGLPELPSREQLVLGAVVVVGAVAGLRRSGVGERLYRAVWLRSGRRSTPEADVERAFERLCYVLERRTRPRRDGETVREYLDAVGADDRARRVARLRERVRYRNEATEAMAEEAFELVEQIRKSPGTEGDSG